MSANNLAKVEAFLALEIRPGPHLLEESVREGSAFRNIVAWTRGSLDLSNKKHVLRFWHGEVTSGDFELRKLLAEKDEQIRMLTEEKERVIEEQQNLSLRLEEEVSTLCNQSFNLLTCVQVLNSFHFFSHNFSSIFTVFSSR